MNQALLITGASRGIGAATAREAATRGCGVCVNYHQNFAAAATVVLDVKAAGGNLNAPWGITKASANFGDGTDQCF